jgi:hypothetical protein
LSVTLSCSRRVGRLALAIAVGAATVCVAFSCVGLATAAAWAFEGWTGTIIFIGSAAGTLAMAGGAALHVRHRDVLGVAASWPGFLLLAATTPVFLGAFASWSPWFLPVLPAALVAVVVPYVSWTRLVR